MKQLLSICSVFTFILAFTISASAQTNVTASADIVQDLVINKASDLSFGQISNSQTTDAVLDPNGTNSGVGNTVSLGQIDVTASPGSTLNISFTSPATLDRSGGGSIVFTPNYTGHTANDASNSTDLTEGSVNTVTADGTSGAFYVYLGGSLLGTGTNSIDGATVGTYEGTITVTIDYQ